MALVGDVAVLVTAVVTLAVAFFVLFLDFRERVHRAFALFLVLRAMLDGFLFFSGEDDAPARLRVYWLIAVPFAALHFGLAFRRRHGKARNPKPAWRAPLVILVCALAFEVLYFLDHSLFGLPPEPPGPLQPFIFLRFPVYAGVAWLFAMEAQQTSSTQGKKALVLAGFGMALAPLYFCAFQIALAGRRIATDESFRFAAEPLFYCFGAIVIFDALRRMSNIATSGDRLRMLWLSAAAIFTSVVTFGAYLVGAGLLAEQVLRGLLAIWAMAAPVCITYALVKHRLFDIEVRLRFAIRGTTMAGVFLAVFFIVNKITENIVARKFENEGIGIYVGGAVAGLLLFALSPLQKLADRIATKAVPQVPSGLSTPDREQLYREQLEIAWRDGCLTSKERLLFTRLQERLGIAASEATRLETEVLRALELPRGSRKRTAPA